MVSSDASRQLIKNHGILNIRGVRIKVSPVVIGMQEGKTLTLLVNLLLWYS